MVLFAQDYYLRKISAIFTIFPYFGNFSISWSAKKGQVRVFALCAVTFTRYNTKKPYFTGADADRYLANTCVGDLFLKSYFNKKRLQDNCFPLKFAEFLEKPVFTEHLRWLLLTIVCF